jgi:hypothetical protein
MPWWGWLIMFGLLVIALTALMIVSIIVKGQRTLFDKVSNVFNDGNRKDWGR